MIFEIFSPKNSAKKLAFFTQNKAKLCNVLIITLVLEKNAIFCQKWQKSQKIVIITSTPDEFEKRAPKMYPWPFCQNECKNQTVE
jgi:hypothetical protein